MINKDLFKAIENNISFNKKKQTEKIVSDFYAKGWNEKNGVTEDARRAEDLRKYSAEYVKNCRLRILKYIPNKGENILDMASGPIQYEEYLEYSKNFKKRFCVDLSAKALESARRKIGDHGVFMHGSFFDLKFENNFFDCSLSLHTIYHIEKDLQENSIRKLIKITKKGAPVIIVYGNPNSIISRFFRPIKRIFSSRKNDPLYFYCHPIEWWDRFKNEADIEIKPWRSFCSKRMRILFPNNKIGQLMLKYLFNLEDLFPRFFINNFQYYTIILRKK